MSIPASSEVPAGRGIEWPTIILAMGIYGGFGLTTWFYHSLPLWLSLPLLAWFAAWHGSLQHELIHGHPTRSRAVNKLIGRWSLALWIPYDSYRSSHLTHHHDERLTDPLDDPESHYWTPEDWGKLGRLRRIVITINNTFLGRMLIGPAWIGGRYLIGEARAILGGDRERARIWADHLLSVIPPLVWALVICDIPIWAYFAGAVYFGTSLMLIRSFAEHRALSIVEERTAIVENAPILGLLFLNNNLHIVHHTHPAMPWYEIPAHYRRNREAYLELNGGLLYNGYLDVIRRYLVTPHDVPVHPFGRAPFRTRPA